MKRLFVAVCSLLSALLWGGCSVHELPEGDGIDPTTVHTEIVLLPGADMMPFDVPEFSTRTAGVHKYKVRYIVEVYADDRFDQSLQFRRQLICEEGDAGEVALECELHARNYRWWHGGTLYLLPRFPATLLSTVFTPPPILLPSS